MQLYRPPVLRRWENQRMLSSLKYFIHGNKQVWTILKQYDVYVWSYVS